MMDWKERGCGGMEGGRQRFRRPRLRSFGIRYQLHITPFVGRQIKKAGTIVKTVPAGGSMGMIWG